jgi:uncharacterized protein (TIGR02001 family)
MRRRAALIIALLCPDAAEAEGWGKLYPTLTAASEYRCDGVSNSSGEPALQGSLYWWRPDHFFAGIFATTVDFSGFYDPDTSYEIDVYAGYNWDFGAPYFEMGGDGSRLTLTAMYTMFPDQGPPGPTYNFLQFTARALHRIDALTLRGEASFVPEASYGAGYAMKAEAGAEYRVAEWLTVGGEIGFRDAERRVDRAYWDAGATLKWGPVEVDVRYHDTNLDYVDCGFSANCGAAVVGKLSVNFWGAWLE